MRTATTTAAALLLGILACVPAKASGIDSSALLFDDSVVRKYTLSFYDTAWKTTLATNWASDSETYLAARFSDGTLVLDSVGVRYKGNTSYVQSGSSLKKPYKIKFNAFRSQTYYGAKTLNFSNGIGDPSMLREKISYDIAKHYFPSPRASFAEIWVDTAEIGVYTQVEQADKVFLKRWFADYGKNLFKAGDVASPLVYLGSDSSLYFTGGLYELKTNETANDWSGFVRFLAFLDSSKVTDSAFCADYATFLDPDNVARYLAFNMVLSNFDSYTGSGRNYYLYQTSDTGAMLVMPWDLNLSFGAYSNEWNVYKQDLITVDNLGSRPLNRRVIACDSLRLRYLGWAKAMIEGPASTDSIKAEIARLAPIVRPHVAAEPHGFYDAAQFDSNQTTKCCGAIPGLASFSSLRNGYLATQLASYLPSGYALSVGSSRAVLELGLERRGTSWRVAGLGEGENARVEILRADGRCLASTTIRSGMSFDIPRGLCLVRVRTDRGSRTLKALNW